MDIGSVPGEIGILPEYRGVTGTLPGEVMDLMGLSGEREGQPGWAARLLPPGLNWTRTRGGGIEREGPPPSPCPIRTGGEGGAALP